MLGTVRKATILVGVLLLVVCDAAGERPDPDQLVVTGEDGGVYLVDPDAGHREALTEESTHPGPVQPTASPDGRIVVWTAAVDEQPVVRIDEEGNRRDVQVPTFPFFYSFDSGADTLAALGNEPDGDGVALVLVDLSRDDARIVDSGRPYYLDWHPSEPLLAVHVGFRELAILEEGDERRALPLRTGDFQAPAWTGDGRLVALHRSEGAAASSTVQAGREELVVLDVSDGSWQTLAAAQGPVVFDVAGERVAYVEGGVGPLRVVDLDGEGEGEVSSDVVVAFEWSPDGDLLLFHVVDEDIGLVPHIWDGEETVEYEPFEPSAVFVGEYLPFWSQYVRTITQWAPDGSAFAYADASEEPTVWIQPVDGERREAGRGVMVTWSQ